MKSFFIIIAFLGILLKTLAENSNCTVCKIDNGAFTESIQKREWSMFTGTRRWLENVQIDSGKTKSHGDYINVTCNTGYSFQGKGLNTNQVQCLNGKFHPNPVCLINGTIYQEESVLISNTSPTGTPETTITPQTVDNTTCTCTYENLNYNLVAYTGLRRLKYGSEVNRGEKVEFYCLLSGFSKLNGPTEITCENCKSWDPSEFPTCVNPTAGDTVLEFRGHWNQLPKNYIGVEKGQWLNVKCISNGIASYPIWFAKNSSSVSTETYIDMYTGNYVNMWNISNASEEHNGDYQCFVAGYRSTSFRVQVINSEILCPKLNEDDLIIHYEKEQTLNSQAAFFCKDGSKKLVGPNLLTCLANGQWSGNPPQCKKPCSVPKVAHGKIGRYVGSYSRKKFQELPEGAKIENNEKLYLTCEAKYEPFGTTTMEKEITCSFGEWSTILRCEPAICRGPPPLTANADLKSVNRTHEGGVVYVCKRYFDKKKHGNVTCSFGTWKGDAAVCKDSKCYLEKLSFPGLETKGLKNVYYRNQAVTATCKSGYNAPKENNRITCVDGEWEGHWPPCLAASCDSKDIDPSEGVILSDDEKTRYLNGEHLIVKCGEGLTPSKSKARCSRGEWIISGKLCVESSCNVVKIDNGAFTEPVQKSKWTFLSGTQKWIEYKKVTLGGTKSPGSSLYVSCNRGYTFQGKGSNDVEVKCRGGKFYPNPVCLIIPTTNCSKFDEREFHIQYDNLQAVNSSASFSCKDKNKKVVGPNLLACLPNGRWSGNPPRCQSVAGCPNPLKTKDPELLVEPDKDFYRFGESVTLACNPGYVLSSEVVRLMCLGSTWSETQLPHCQEE